MILITGAAGKTGRTVIQALQQKAQPMRAYVRRAEQAQGLAGLGVTEIAIGDLNDPAALQQALQGVRALYHICPNMHPNEVQIGRNVIGAAQAAGVEQFVYHSVLHPQTAAMPHHWNKLHVEELIFEAGLPFTILQPTAYMQNILAGWKTIVEQGVYTIPYPMTTRLSFVDLADVGAVAAQVLTEPGHLGASYELVGTLPLSQQQIATVLSEQLGRPVQVNAVTLETWERNARATGLGDYAIDTLVQMFRYYEHFGLVGNPNVLRWLLGREPTTLAAFIKRSID